MRRIGLHARSAGSLASTAERAHALGANTLQIFTSSPRTWRGATHSPADIRALQRVRERLDLAPLVVHDNYLINLASADPTVRAKSIEAFREELDRAARIGAEYLVAHPGSAKGIAVEEALANVVEGIVEASRGLNTGSLTLLLECTAGAGAALGARLEELRALRQVTTSLVNFPVGFCLDTCHLLAAGFDVATAGGLRRTAAEIGDVLGWEHVKVVHANDSKGALGSRLDRHENIGEGQIGKEGFRRILAHPDFRRLPFILETPIETDTDARHDIDMLRTLCQRSRTITQ